MRHHAALWLCVDNSSSADREMPLATHALRSGNCQEPGIALRVRHLRTCQSLAPEALAAAAIAGQRSGEKTSIAQTRDRSSPLSRPSVPLREKTALRCLGMKSPPSRKLYRAQLSKRMKTARKRANLSQSEVAGILGITPEAYKKSEQRGALWADLIEPFALAVHEEAFFILTGRRMKTRKAGQATLQRPSRAA